VYLKPGYEAEILVVEIGVSHYQRLRDRGPKNAPFGPSAAA